jgi:hypothetical protein
MFDWYLLGWPGLIVFLAIVLALLATCRVLARRGVRTRWLISGFVVAMLAANMFVYFISIRLPRPPRNMPNPLESRSITDQ